MIFYSETTALPENIFFRLVDRQNMIFLFKKDRNRHYNELSTLLFPWYDIKYPP